jgi:hypothetical protein
LAWIWIARQASCRSVALLAARAYSASRALLHGQLIVSAIHSLQLERLKCEGVVIVWYVLSGGGGEGGHETTQVSRGPSRTMEAHLKPQSSALGCDGAPARGPRRRVHAGRAADLAA